MALAMDPIRAVFNRLYISAITDDLGEDCSLVPRPIFPTAAGGLHHRYVHVGWITRSGDVIHPQLLGIWVWDETRKTGEWPGEMPALKW